MRPTTAPECAASRGHTPGSAEDPVEASSAHQYSVAGVLGVWGAAALPMGALAWVVAPVAANHGGGVPLARALIGGLTVGLVWQCLLVPLRVHRERGSLRWPVLKEALWPSAPQSPRTGDVGGRLWLVLVPVTLLFATSGFLPTPPPAAGHDMRAFLDSDAGRTFLSHDWKWFPVIVVLVLFNTLLAEELFFCGLLLPRMRRVFGRRDWAANAFLFAVFHPHMPCAMPSTLLVDTLALSYPWRRYYSAPIGIIVHTSQSIFVLALPLTVVLRKGDGTDRT